jgi:hypothetical protein
VLLRALDVFAADAATREWLQKEVTAYGDSMRHGGWRRLRGLLPSLCRRGHGRHRATSYSPWCDVVLAMVWLIFMLYFSFDIVYATAWYP